MKIQVLDVQNMIAPNARTSSALLALATIQVGPLVLYRCRLIKNGTQRAYVSPPQLEYLKADGKSVGYWPLAKWPDEWKQPILKAVWTAYQAETGPR